MKEKILCAAIWYKDVPLKKDIPQVRPKNIDRGIVVAGYRHGHCLWTMACLTGLRTATFADDGTGDHEQGFLTNHNRFVDRKEAYKIAYENDQIIGPNRGIPDNEIGLTSEDLYSEDLY
jgi:hypothetical protein